MEQKIDGLVALLAQQDNNRASSNAKEGFQSSKSPSTTVQSPFCTEQQFIVSQTASSGRQTDYGTGHSNPDLSPISPLGYTPRESYERAAYRPEQRQAPSRTNSTYQSEKGKEGELNQALAKDLVDSVQANNMLNTFREMSDFFPFVVLPEITTQILELQKPMLSLAILMTASGKDRSLQIHLEERYRHELATRTIINAGSSLDILQSILIYLAWSVACSGPKMFTERKLQVSLLFQPKSSADISIAPSGYQHGD